MEGREGLKKGKAVKPLFHMFRAERGRPGSKFKRFVVQGRLEMRVFSLQVGGGNFGESFDLEPRTELEG